MAGLKTPTTQNYNRVLVDCAISQQTEPCLVLNDELNVII